jgi:DnaJ-class molecular chaperone
MNWRRDDEMAEPKELGCRQCAGTGKVRMIFDIVPGRMPPEFMEIDCPKCRGKGLAPVKA